MLALTITAVLATAVLSYEPTCRASGERCLGAAYKPVVPWVPCCDGGCDVPHPEWGMICGKPKASYVEKKYDEEKPKCRKAGERCIGAAYKPAVPWIPCCEGGCDAEHPDWGMMCGKKEYVKKYAEEKPKCRKEGERCIGAAYKPAVPWIPCCEGGCDVEHPDWGMMCSKAYKVPVYGKAKCYGVGEKCAGAENMPYVEYRACCEEGSACSVTAGYGDWGIMCSVPKGYKKKADGMPDNASGDDAITTSKNAAAAAAEEVGLSPEETAAAVDSAAAAADDAGDVPSETPL